MQYMLISQSISLRATVMLSLLCCCVAPSVAQSAEAEGRAAESVWQELEGAAKGLEEKAKTGVEAVRDKAADYGERLEKDISGEAAKLEPEAKTVEKKAGPASEKTQTATEPRVTPGPAPPPTGAGGGSVVKDLEAGAKELEKEVKPIGQRAIEYDEMLRGEVASEEEKIKAEAESLERKAGLKPGKGETKAVPEVAPARRPASAKPSGLDKLGAEAKGVAEAAEKDVAEVRTDVDRFGDRLHEDLKRLNAEYLSDLGARLHYELAVINRFPSAAQCADCHPAQYREWASSPHAYAQISPMFNAMQGTFIKRSGGTNGDFCIRCHSEVGMTLNEPLFTSNAKRSMVSREGITCVVCHRIGKPFGRVSGRFGLEQGDIYQPMYGPLTDEILKKVIQEYNVSPAPGVKVAGQAIHSGAEKRLYFSNAQLCSMCHDVNSQNGFRLESAYTQFLNSPAKKRGEVCQDCHMGKIPGIESGYEKGPVAHIGGVPTPAQKRTNHAFPGPDYSIVHPGIFPHSTEGPTIAAFEDWLSFDFKAGWGSDIFESVKHDDHPFPEAWKSHHKRRRAYKFIEAQIARLAEADVGRYQLLRRAYQFGAFVVDENSSDGISFRLQVKNGTDGHNAPTGFDSERIVFVQVTVTDREGTVIFRSGDRDPNGDLRDLQSRYVHNWEVPADPYLLSLESDFLGLTIRGGLRSEILTVDFSQTPLPFVRPNTASSLLTGRPPDTQKFVRTLPPNGTRWGEYLVKPDALTGKTPYTVNIKFIAQMMPVHLVWDVSGVGFDYGLSARDVADRIVKGALVLWEHNILLDAHAGTLDLTPTEEQILHSPPQKSKDSWRIELEQIF